MKLNKYSWLAVLPMIFTACQDDTLVESQQQDKIYTLSATMDGGAAMSRAQIVIGNDAEASEGETFFWNEGDAFDMYQEIDGEWIKTTFTTNNEENNSSATFASTNPATAGLGFKAFYPSNNLNNGVDHNLPSSIDFTNSNVDTWKEYFSESMLMMATSESLSAENPIVEFKHLCSLARITYTNKTGVDQAIDYYCLNGHFDNTFGISYNYNIGNNESGGSTADRCALEVSGLNVPNNESVDLYLLFFPKEFVTDGKLQVIIKHPSTEEGIVNQVNTSDIAVSDISKVNDNAEGFEAGKRYWFKVTETADGLVWTKNYTEGPADDAAIVIENQELSYALSEKYSVTLNDDGYAVMTGAEVKGYSELQLGLGDYTITSLAGIENFVNLEILACEGVGLQECDLRQNEKLIYLDVSHNRLTNLDVSNNPSLEDLSCSYNAADDDENNDYAGLSSLTMTNCSKLTHLSVEHTALEALTIPNPSKLETLYMGNTNISFDSFSLDNFTSLTGLDVDNMNLDDLEIIPDEMKSRLTWLYCDDNNLTSLDLTQYPLVMDLHCNYNDIVTLTLTDTEFTSSPLSSLYCIGNKMEALDITGTNISSLGCGKQQNGIFLKLTLSDDQKESWNNSWKSNSDNVFVYLDGEELETITIEDESFAQELKNQFGDNVILQDGKAIMTKSFVESKTELWFWGTEGLTTLEGIRHFTKLEKLVCVYHKLTSLDVSGLSSLKVLECWEGTLSTLNVTGCTALEEINCHTNALTELDVTSCTNLTALNCSDNKLTSLDLTKCTNDEITLLCGNQGNKAGEEITITIKLTGEMKTYWKSYLMNLDYNQVRVVLYGDNSVTIPSLPKEEWGD